MGMFYQYVVTYIMLAVAINLVDTIIEGRQIVIPNILGIVEMVDRTEVTVSTLQVRAKYFATRGQHCI